MTTKKPTSKKKSDQPEDDKKKPAAAGSAKAKKAGAAPKAKKAVRKVEEEVEEEKKVRRPFITPPPPKVEVAAPVVAPSEATPPPPPPPAPKVAATPPAPPAPSEAAPPAAPSKPATRPAPPPARPQRPTAPPKPFTRTFAPSPTPPKRVDRPSPPVRRAPDRAPAAPAAASPAAPAGKKKIQFNEMMTVKDLAAAMEAKIPDVIKKLLGLGTPATINQRVSAEVAALLAEAFGFELEVKSIYREETADEPENEAALRPRPPVVTVMGHVDHGKTSLLDAIRSTSVASGEAGGITQHIGAHQVTLPKGSITFLDTPGHEAFTAMRARGAMATDLVILVVAADDSVMPQTVEALDHARAAEVPIVVAINKVDLPTANVAKVKQELAQHNLLSEDWGGKTIMVEVSAKTGQNVDKLLEMILLEAEILELKANPDRPAKGVVLEAHTDPRRGNTATVLVQAGTLRVGDVIVCGLTHGRVRAILDERWKTVEKAGPSVPVPILGLSQVPQVGDQLSVVTGEREAREIAERRRQFITESAGKKSALLSLESLHAQIAEGKIQDLPIILKTDVQGSLQALQDSLGKLSGALIQVRMVHAGVGNINESDILLAEASNAIVFGFNVKIEPSAEAEAKRAEVDVRTYAIIYEMLADVRAAMEGLLEPEEREVVKGRAVVKDLFSSPKFGVIAGCLVAEGKVVRGGRARVIRQNQEVGTGPISSLRRFKDDVKEVEKGFECGLSVDGFRGFQRGDVVEIIAIEKHARRLDA